MKQSKNVTAQTARGNGRARPAAGPPVHEETYRRLRAAVLFGELAPGQPVTIQGLTEMLGVSATPAREAIRRLTAEGALEFKDNRRVSVPVLDRGSIEEVRFARLALEPELARRAAERADPDLIDSLSAADDALDRSIEERDIEGYLRNNYAFHFKLYGAADAPILASLVDGLWLRFGPSMRRVLAGFVALQGRDMHKVVLDALRRDAPTEVAAAIKGDVRQGMDILAESLGRGED